MSGWIDLARPVRLYLATVVVTALAMLAAALVAAARIDLTRLNLLQVVVLSAMAIGTWAFPLHLTYRANIDVGNAIMVAMILLLPPPLSVILVAMSAGIGLRLRRQPDIIEWSFNTAQITLSVAVAAIGYQVGLAWDIGPHIAEFGSIGAMSSAIGLVPVVNSGLVAVIIGLDLKASPWRIWAHVFTTNFLVHLLLGILGVVIAVIVADHPWILPAFALPVAMIYFGLRAMIQLRQERREVLTTLAGVVELRDAETAHHSRRVAVLARMLALQLGMIPEEADEIAVAAQLHDLGKVAIAETTLRKTAPLSEAEWTALRRAPDLGGKVIDQLSFGGNFDRIIRHVHERWDGTGYPYRLAGEAIPLGARILAVADAFDAMTSDRPYRSAMGIEQAAAILVGGAGSEWDPRVVAALLSHLAASAPRAIAPEMAQSLAVPTYGQGF